MVVTNSDELASKVRILKGQGMDPLRQYWFPVVGYNYRMTNIQAALGLAQLDNVEKFLVKRKRIARMYDDNLRGVPGLTLPVEKNYATRCYWMYSILIEQEYGRSRDDIRMRLAGQGVETRPFFYPMHVMPVYADKKSPGLKNAELIAAKGINLPTFYQLEEEQIQFISNVLKRKCRQ